MLAHDKPEAALLVGKPERLVVNKVLCWSFRADRCAYHEQLRVRARNHKHLVWLSSPFHEEVRAMET